MPDRARRAIRAGVRVVLDDPRPAAPRDPTLIASLLELATASEQAGLDGFFLSPGSGIDPYVVLGAAAAVTSAIALGCLAAPVGERPPAMLAKVVTTLDVCSQGRAVLGLATRRGSAAAGGIDLVELTDALEISRAMVRVPSPSYAGRTASIATAWNEPRWSHGEPTPLALLVPEAATREPRGAAVGGSRAELLVCAARLAELCAVELGSASPGDNEDEDVAGQATMVRSIFDAACFDAGRLPGEVALVAVCNLAPGHAPASVEELVDRTSAWRNAGYDGVVVDIRPEDLVRGDVADLLSSIPRS